MGKRRIKLSEQIRQAIDASSLSRYQICKETKILESSMSRFMNRECGLSMECLDRIADLLGLHITRGKKG
jgi:hypothetical protein